MNAHEKRILVMKMGCAACISVTVFLLLTMLAPANSPDPLHHSTTQFDNCTLNIETDSEIGKSIIQVYQKDIENESMHMYAIKGSNTNYTKKFEGLNMVTVQYMKLDNNRYTVTGDIQEMLRC